MSLLATFKILGLLVNTLTADDKYYFRARQNLLQPIQIQLSKKHNVSSDVFALIMKSTS